MVSKEGVRCYNTERSIIFMKVLLKSIKFYLHYGDLTDSSNITRLVKEIKPDEIYNLGAQSHVAVSFDVPEYSADVDAMGTLRILESIRLLGIEKK